MCVRGSGVVFDPDTVDLGEAAELESADLGESWPPEVQEAVQRFQKLPSSHYRSRKMEGEDSEKGETAEKELEIGECGCVGSLLQAA